LEGYIIGEVDVEGEFIRQGQSATTKFAEIVSSTTTELERLLRNPALFPNETSREWFFDELETTASHLQKAIKMMERFHKGQQNFLETRAEGYEEARLPLRDEGLKPWQQFLSKNAPACQLTPQLIVNPGAAQIIPMPGVRILLDMINGAKEIYREIENVSTWIALQTERAFDTYSVQGQSEEAEPEVRAIGHYSRVLLLRCLR